MASIETYSLYCLIYIIPGFLFYSYFAFHLFTINNAELKSRFFVILRILTIVDLAEIFVSIISLRMGYLLSQIPFFQPPGQYNVISTILAFGTVFFNCVQASLHTVMAFNRLTAILFPHNYGTLWNGKYLFAIISIAFIIPGIAFSWILYFGGHVFFSPVFSAVVVDAMRTTGVPWLKKPIIHIIILASTCILAFTFDVLTFILLRKGNLLQSNATKYKQEFRLLTVSFAFLFIHTLSLATAVYSFAVPFRDGILLLIFLQSTTELQSLISPFCVLLMDGKFRRDFFNQKSKITVISQVTTRPAFKQSKI